MIERVVFGRLIRSLAVVLLVVSAFAPAATRAGSALVPAHVTFAGIPWATTRRDVRARLEALGFSYVASNPDDFYHGSVDGAGATLVCVFTPEDELTYVRVYFDDDAKVPAALDALHDEYGNPAHCDARETSCRWERGSEEVTYNAPSVAAATPNTPNVEYSETGLAVKYDFEINHKEHQYHDKSDM